MCKEAEELVWVPALHLRGRGGYPDYEEQGLNISVYQNSYFQMTDNSKLNMNMNNLQLAYE